MTSTTQAENYQLKWHSHLSNLNSSVATLYRNDKFADVMLVPSNSVDCGVGIPAHKIILSTCSHYFASIFENNPTPPNSLIYVVLPAELSRKSLQILIQYMYSGEATVSNDILNEVLRGGELLRIRGLWRSNHHGSDPQGPSQRPVEAAGATRVIKQDVSVIDKHLSEMGVKPPSNGALKESPVLVMHPHVATPTPYTPPIQNLAVKKDVAIDPGEGRPIPSSHYGLVSLQIAAAVKKAQQHSEKRTKSLSGTGENGPSTVGQSLPGKSSESSTSRCVLTSDLRTEASRSSVESRRIVEVAPRQDLPEGSHEHDLSFLGIKQEPVEWTEFEQQNGIERQHMEITVKPEMIYQEEAPDEHPEEMQEPIYSPLTCELCSETFTIPGEWVRHIESFHSDSPSQTIPKKRRRTEDTASENIAALRCDLCSMFFITPAEWVRHVQNTHTETELAISNNSAPPKRNIRMSRPLDGQTQDKSCSICHKTFPSYASMEIHKRTHTAWDATKDSM
ncbi:modifier of mdg4 isoform X2 [Phlebotomus papatasi]|uniref:modifier of mdg4 isoform X2 n=1 Tax=Phlebotomus papatasi TaxID=29031 RepID=UPI00248372BB|nr:modifier of mdg4 isoform X2 [Phlebotomus papatasi]